MRIGHVRSHRRYSFIIASLIVLSITSSLLLALRLVDKTKDEVPPDAPSITKPTAVEVDNHTASPTAPKYVTIDKYDVKARVIPLGVDKNNQLESPTNVHDVGWYDKSSAPGQAGAMLMDGHVSSWDTPGVFYNLKNLMIGDTLQVERGDGVIFTYEIVATHTYPVEGVDMSKALEPIDSTRPGLNLITCGGAVVKGTNRFSHRVIVYTRQL